jgi:hypothetical protein
MTLDSQDFPIVDHLDAEIIMHRDVHFGGQFSVMLHYYEQEGKGTRPEFNPRRIHDLYKIEQTYKMNLKEHLLSEDQRVRVVQAQQAYQKLKQMFEVSQNPNSPALKLADLLLSEEENPVNEINQVVAFKNELLNDLLQIFATDAFYDSLFPGYGYAPELVARCLGLIGSELAIEPLFSRIAQVDFYIEDVILEALKNIGEPAKQFLMKIIQQAPISESNERAAVALIHFRQDLEVARLSLKLMKEPSVRANHTLMGYLIVISEGLKGTEEAKFFQALKDDTSLPKLLRDDIEEVTRHWPN